MANKTKIKMLVDYLYDKFDNKEARATLGIKADEVYKNFQKNIYRNERVDRLGGIGYFLREQSDDVVRILAERADKIYSGFQKVIVVIGGRETEYKSRRHAIKFFHDAIHACEGSEQERYIAVYFALKEGKTRVEIA